MMLRRGLTG
jgi:hypothetical protein